MGKKAKRSNTSQVSSDYISASPEHRGVMQDVAEYFGANGRYVAPGVAAVCGLQGAVLPMGQVYAAVVTPADSVTVGSGDVMLLPYASSSAVTSATVNSGGNITVQSGGTANDTTVNSSGAMIVQGGIVNGTQVNASGTLVINFGGVASSTVLNGESFTSQATMQVASGSAISTTVNAGTILVTQTSHNRNRLSPVCGEEP